ncbi:helix-turn-helix domain-containing protein [Candidatus Poseidoniales archaeon]|nr:helix-turn-helix domain-containing protein [Candidatus Poseidoniales archaeon]
MQISITAEQGSMLPGVQLLSVYQRVEFLYAIGKSARGMHCLVSIDYDDVERLEVGDTTMEILEVIKKSDTNAVCEVLLTGTLSKFFATQKNVWWVSPSQTHPRGMTLTIRGTRDSLREVRNALENILFDGYDMRLGSESEYHPEFSDILPERQTVVLNKALSMGYYDRPRQCTQRDIAESLHVKQATVSEHLQSAEATIIKKFTSEF